jgi:rhodanese-related sulfurtransferase
MNAGSEIHIFSPSLGEMSVPLSQLDEDRLGQAIILSSQAVGSDEPFIVAHRQIGRYLAMGVVAAAILLLTIVEYRRRPLRSKVRSTAWRITDSIMGGCGFAAAALVIGMSSQLLQGAPLLPTGPPVDSTGKGPVLDFMLIRSSADTSQPVAKPPEISLQSALHGLSLGETFVDARDLGEYNAGHIKGAICCPASDVGRWRMHMSGIDPKTRIVVYCAEASCGKGEYVATFLLENGFTDVSLYRAGWADWTGPKE